MNDLNTAQIEQLQKIANHLRQQRQDRNISLEEIAVKTYIPLRLLQALDTGNVERLPEPVFVQGFIRRYADALGLDGWALAKTFSVEPQATDAKSPDARRSESDAIVESIRVEEPVEPVRVPSPTPLPQSPQPSIQPSQRQGVPPLVWIAGGLALLLGIGAIAAFNRPKTTANQSNTAVPPSPQASSQPPSEPAVTPSASPSPMPQASVSPTPAPTASPDLSVTTSSVDTVDPTQEAPLAVSIDLKDGDSWIEVIVDGKSAFQGTLKKGEQRTWEAKQRIELISGNAGAVYISTQNGEEKQFGKLGEVKALTLTNPNPTTPTPAASPAVPDATPGTTTNPSTN